MPILIGLFPWNTNYPLLSRKCFIINLIRLIIFKYLQMNINHLSEPLCSESMLVKNCASVGKTCRPFCLQINYKWGISTSFCDFKADSSMLCSCVYVPILNNLGQNSKITTGKTDDKGVKSRENIICFLNL